LRGAARVKDVPDEDDLRELTEDVDDEDVWDPAAQAEPRGVDLEAEADKEDLNFAAFLADMEADPMRELSTPGTQRVPSLGSTCSPSFAELEDADCDLLRAFMYKIKHHATDTAFRDLPYIFPQANGELLSWKEAQSRITRLSSLMPKLYDCCINSCAAFTGPWRTLTHCPYSYCRQACFNETTGRPRKQFLYLPTTPCLVAFYANLEQNSHMPCHAKFEHEDGITHNIFDGIQYHSLLGQLVTPIGRQLQLFRYFLDPRDAALGLSTDGYAPFKKRKKRVWPILSSGSGTSWG
jgi:hypothetical protein